MTTQTTAPTPMTPEQKQVRYAYLLQDLQQDSVSVYEKAKREFAQVAADSGYDYAARWRLEPVLQAEHLVRFIAPAVSVLKTLMDRSETQAEAQQHLAEYAEQLKAELVRQKPWEHRCTCAITNLAALIQASAKAEAVEKIESLRYRLSRVG